MNLEPQIQAELWAAIQSNYERQNYTGAIQDAMYFLSESLRQKSGGEGDGIALVNQALAGENPRVKLNKLQSESEKNIQVGVAQILRGVFQGIRNPRSHEKFEDSARDADAIIIFVDYLLRQLETASLPFNKAEFIGRVLDKKFFADVRYCDLLVNEIPEKLKFEVFLDLYAQRTSWRPDAVRIFLQQLFKCMSPQLVTQVARVVSDDLRMQDKDNALIAVVGAIGPLLWPQLDHVCRLRVENLLVQSVREGQYSRKKECTHGVLGTWSISVFEDFTLKDELLWAAMERLRTADEAGRSYIKQYILPSLDRLYSEPPERLQAHLKYWLKHDLQYFEAIYEACLWRNEAWSNDVMIEMNNCIDKMPPDTVDFLYSKFEVTSPNPEAVTPTAESTAASG